LREDREPGHKLAEIFCSGDSIVHESFEGDATSSRIQKTKFHGESTYQKFSLKEIPVANESKKHSSIGDFIGSRWDQLQEGMLL